MIAVLIIIIQIVGVMSAVHAVMKTRTEQGAIAWGIALVAMPYVAVPAYWIFGRSRFEGYVTARKVSEETGEDLFADVRERVAPFHLSSDASDQALLASERLADQPMLRGNAVELLVDGQATFESMLNGIDNAREYILFQFFIVKDDEIGRQVKKHLVAKAEEGVRVFFLYDEVGSHALAKAYLDELRAASLLHGEN